MTAACPGGEGGGGVLLTLFFPLWGGETPRLYTCDPVHLIDFEFIANQIVCIADNDAVCFRIKVNHIAGPRRTAGKSFALPNSEQLDPFVFAEKVSGDIVNLAAMKFFFAQMGA